MPFKKNIVIAALMIVAVFAIGIIGYSFLMPDWSLLKSIYMTAITLTTVGFSDYGIWEEYSQAAMVFTTVLIIAGIGIFTFGVTSLLSFIVEGHLSNVLRYRKMQKAISKLKGHYIICGAGETGVHVIDSLKSRNVSFVVIDKDADRINRLLLDREFLYIVGDAAEDEILLRAGIEKAKGVISILSTDRDNLFVSLSARTINPKITIVSKAVESKSVSKIKKSGADYVVMPDSLGGLRMASLLLRPNVVDFIDEIRSNPVYKMVEAKVTGGSNLIGRQLMETEIRKRTGLTIFAVRRGNDFIYNPKPDFLLAEDDGIVVIGTKEQIASLGAITGDESILERWFS